MVTDFRANLLGLSDKLAELVQNHHKNTASMENGNSEDEEKECVKPNADTKTSEEDVTRKEKDLIAAFSETKI